MKKLLAVLLTGILLIPGSMQTAYAAETNGVYEAENAKIEGQYQTLDWTTFQPIEVNPVEENANASGGKNVGYFGTVGNSITWTVPADSAGAADLTFVLASCINETDASWQFKAHKECPLEEHLEIKVNGTALDVTNKVVPAKKDATQSTYDYYQDVTFEGISLNAGDNTISITVIGVGSNPMSQETVNVDCLKVSNFTAGAAGSNNGNTGSAGHAKLRIEAENADVVADLSSMSWMGVTSAVEEKASASGGKSIGYFGAVGNKVTWKFEASAAGKAIIELGLASGATDMATFANVDMMLADGAKVLVNGKELNCEGINLPAGNYENWTKVPFDVDVVAGMNEVILEITGSVAPNVDYLEVSGDSITFTTTQTSSSGNTSNSGSNAGNIGGSNSGSNSGNNFFPGNDNETNINANKPNNTKTSAVTTQQTVKKEPVAMVRDGIIGIVIACIVAFVGAAAAYVIYMKFIVSEEEKAAADSLVKAAEARKEAWKKEYSELTDSEEKEISRVRFAMDEKAARAERMAIIDKMTYAEGVRAVKAEKLADMSASKLKNVFPLLSAAAIIGGVIGANFVSAEDCLTYADGPASAKYTLVISGYDWGPGVNKVVIELDGKVKPENLKKADFKVDVSYQGWMGATETSRTVTNMYLSNATGNEVTKKSEYITLEFEVGPTMGESNPFFYDFMSGVNKWASPYSYTISLEPGSELIVDGKVYSSAVVRNAGKISPDADVFNTYSGEFEGITLSYAAYEPKELKEDKVKNALIIWLHGAGEGGTDPYIDVLGNKVTALVKEDIQNLFDGNGAYVLTPQSPTMWMNDGSGEYTQDGTSMYIKSLKALIDAYVANNSDIDTNRIIIGGCSNGGFMTMNMILTYPEYFAAAYPICEAYKDEWITDEMLGRIKNLPIWFTHAKTDKTVNPDEYTVATYNRLKASGAGNVHFTFYDDVRDISGLYRTTDGSAHVYDGHWSWIYTLNNDCKVDFDGTAVKLNGKEVTIWEWLAAQSK